MVDARDLKSLGTMSRVGSIPTLGTSFSCLDNKSLIIRVRKSESGKVGGFLLFFVHNSDLNVHLLSTKKKTDWLFAFIVFIVKLIIS